MQAVQDRGEIVLELFERYYERVYCFARRSLDASAAEDVAQEVFTRLLAKEDLAGREIRSSYLIKIAHNLIKRRYQRSQRLERIARRRAEERQASAAEGGVTPEFGGAERSWLGVLASHEADAVRLIVCEGLSYQQAAEALGVRVTAVNNWKFRGLKRLRDHADRAQANPSVPGRDAGSVPRERRGSAGLSRAAVGARGR